MWQWLASLSGWVTRAAAPPMGTSVLLLGDMGTGTTYSPATALSTLARFPWVWTCARAIAEDVGGLPLVAVRTAPDGTRALVDDPALRLLERPALGMSGNLLRKQLRIDFDLTGNAYLWRPSPVELIRLHPARVQVRTEGLAHTVVEYLVRDDDGRTHKLGPTEVLHIRDVSWEEGPTAALGESVVRCLHDDLTMELGSKKLAASQAAKGRPDVIFTSEKGMAKEEQDLLNGRWEAAAKSGRLAFTVGRDLKVQQLSWSPREFEFAARSEHVRDAVLAALGVPPARAGLATANYGTQKQQMRTYWEQIRSRTRAFDDAFTTLAQPGVRIEHDFADVESLQVSYTERQQRVVTWRALGADPNEAAAYEGFDDAPVMSPTDVQPSSGSGTTARPEEPQGDKAIGDYLRESAPRMAELARHAAEGASIDLVQRLEVERAWHALAAAGAPLDAARAAATDIVEVSIEAARAALADGVDPITCRAFGPVRAAAIAARVLTEAA